MYNQVFPLYCWNDLLIFFCLFLLLFCHMISGVTHHITKIFVKYHCIVETNRNIYHLIIKRFWLQSYLLPFILCTGRSALVMSVKKIRELCPFSELLSLEIESFWKDFVHFFIAYSIITRHHSDMEPTLMRPLMSDLQNGFKVKCKTRTPMFDPSLLLLCLKYDMTQRAKIDCIMFELPV